VKRFFHLLDAVKSLKARSLAAYAAIDGIKKSWFGLASSWSGRVALLGLDRPQRHADEFGVGADARLPVDGSRPAGAEGIHAEAGRRAGTDFLQTLRQPNRQRLADDRRAWRRTLRIGVATRQGGGDRRQRTTQAIPWCS